ncbi:glycoside hydrolase family 16 protein [Streptomyces sp. CB03238]|uniref:glycoside hydrolase family 16 protein n=1 Tax=Streptomyces sp. CB03238 TaxID=1907777 RepID=UPI0015C459C8|nr:glycoside hydrolase family 16 protein [Streptomyces sp. CB03238]
MKARMRFAPGNGAYSAFWAAPSDDQWPPEIDAIEYLGDRPDLGHATHHWARPEGGNTSNSQDFVNAALADGGWHTIGVDWQPGQLIWYVDGREVTRSRHPEGVASEPMHLAAVGRDLGQERVDIRPGQQYAVHDHH